MAQPSAEQRKNAFFNSRDIRDVNALNKNKDMDDPFPSEVDGRVGVFVETLREALNDNIVMNKEAKKSRKQKLWSTDEIRNQLLNFLLGRQPYSVNEDGVQRIENTYNELHSTDSKMPGDMEYIPTPIYNASPEAAIRLMKARSSGANQRRNV